MKLKIIILLCTATVTSAQESLTISGNIIDAVTRETLAAANIRVLGTSQGTVANADGKYRLQLWPGKRVLVFSSLGYKPDTMHILLTNDDVRNVALTPSDIILPEVVVTSEDPAIEIMRRVIANKKQWMDRLRSFEMDAFTRQVLKRDTSIASITESFTKGYWQQGDTLREIVKQKRQTENIKSEFNFASVGRILNFYDDEIRFIGYTFVGPTAIDALDYYDYKLMRTRAGYGKEIYEIRMIPRSRTTPLFEGTINIAGDSYALMGVDVVPNQAFSIPFAKEKSIRYRQQFGLYENSFWMPADIRIDASATITFAVISIPKIVFSQTSVITNYGINTTIPDSIFKKPRLTIDTMAAATLDTTFWHTNLVLPLTMEETQAYATLDSTQSLEVQFRPGGISIGVGVGDSGSVSLLEHVDVLFNRVEGLHVGVKNKFKNFSNLVDVNAGFAYGFSDKRWKYNLGATVFTGSARKFGIGGEVFRRVDHRPDAGYYGNVYNSLTSIFVKNDYRDYYESEGWRVFLTFTPTTIVKTELSFSLERQSTVQQNSDFGIFARHSIYRANPRIDNGKYSIIRWDTRIGEEAVPFEFVRRNALEFHAENMQRNDYSASRIWGTATLSVPTFSRSMLFPQTLALRVSGGVSENDLHPQQLFDLESTSSSYAPFGVFKAMNVKEFSGTSFVAVNLEHNFRSIPFLALGIPFLYENNIELVVHGGMAKTWDTNPNPVRWSGPTTSTYSHPPLNTTQGWYSELGFGFSRIFDVLRADFSWRVSEPNNFRFTLGAASLF